MKKIVTAIFLLVSSYGSIAQADTFRVIPQTVSRSPDGFATGWAIHDYDPPRCPATETVKQNSTLVPMKITKKEEESEASKIIKSDVVFPNECTNRSMEKVESHCNEGTWRLSGIIFYDTLSSAEGKVLGAPTWFENSTFLAAETEDQKAMVSALCR